ncbi:MAG: hypothetical protein LBM60_01455 [Clostridium sp.]|nr:hypothetical protein [Clostridium sp.]
MHSIAIQLPDKTVSAVETGEKQGFNISNELRAAQGLAKQETEKDDRLEKIMNKARSGIRLSEDELQYLAKKAPEVYAKVRAAMAERDAMKRSMEAAKTKEQVTGVLVTNTAMVQQTSDDEFVMAMRSNLLAGAHREYTSSAHYAAKEDLASQAKEQTRRLQRKFAEEESLKAAAKDLLTDAERIADATANMTDAIFEAADAALEAANDSLKMVNITPEAISTTHEAASADMISVDNVQITMDAMTVDTIMAAATTSKETYPISRNRDTAPNIVDAADDIRNAKIQQYTKQKKRPNSNHIKINQEA